MSKKMLYRVIFNCQDVEYEIYARKICESELFGFLEIEELVFGETSALLVDPSEERLKLEFAEVKRTFIPMHSVHRIDEINKESIVKIKAVGKAHSKISVFPVPNKDKNHHD